MTMVIYLATMMMTMAALVMMTVLVMTRWISGDQEASEPGELQRNSSIGTETGTRYTETEERKKQTILLSLAYQKVLAPPISMNFQPHLMNI